MTVDTQYRDLLRYILKYGKFHNDPNRVGVRRLNIPSYVFQVPIDTVPAVSIKKSFPALAMKELSLFMRGETDIREYWKEGVHFWDKDWYNFNGYKNNAEIIDIKENTENYSHFDLGKIYPYQYRNFGGSFDQMEDLLYKMLQRPMSSSILVNIWNPSEFKEMCLPPCHYGFKIAMEKLQTGYGFHLTWDMRSSDVFLGLPMNTMYYFYLGKILEKVTYHKFLSLTGVLQNVHLYDNSVDAAKDVVLNRPKHIHKLSQLEFSPYLEQELSDLKGFWDNLPSDAVKLTGYESYPHYKVDMLAYDN